MRARRRGWPAIVSLGATLLGAAACGGDDGGLSSELLADFEGVYQLDTATENPAACDAEGASVLDTIAQKQFVAVALRMLTIQGLQLISCADDAGCAETAMRAKGGSGWAASWSWFFSDSLGADQLGGLSASSGFNQNGTCTDRTYTALTLTRTGDMLRLEARQTNLADVPADGGICWAEPAKQRSEAAALPCSSLRVLTGSRRGPLP
jgi:hypothetical protein